MERLRGLLLMLLAKVYCYCFGLILVAAAAVLVFPGHQHARALIGSTQLGRAFVRMAPAISTACWCALACVRLRGVIALFRKKDRINFVCGRVSACLSSA